MATKTKIVRLTAEVTYDPDVLTDDKLKEVLAHLVEYELDKDVNLPDLDDGVLDELDLALPEDEDSFVEIVFLGFDANLIDADDLNDAIAGA